MNANCIDKNGVGGRLPSRPSLQCERQCRESLNPLHIRYSHFLPIIQILLMCFIISVFDAQKSESDNLIIFSHVSLYLFAQLQFLGDGLILPPYPLQKQVHPPPDMLRSNKGPLQRVTSYFRVTFGRPTAS